MANILVKSRNNPKKECNKMTYSHNQTFQYCVDIHQQHLYIYNRLGVIMKKKTNTKTLLLCKIKDNLLIFLVIQTLTLLAVFFDVNVERTYLKILKEVSG